MDLKSKKTVNRVKVKPVILHVDRDESALLMAEGPLIGAGFDVIHATNGSDALKCFYTHSPDFIIMQAEVSGVDGYEAIAKIKKSPLGAHTPILVTTLQDDIVSISKAYEAGATDFITKPINYFVLAYRVRHMLRSKTSADELRLKQERYDKAHRIARLGHWEWDVVADRVTWSREVAFMLGKDENSIGGSLESMVARVGVVERQKVIDKFLSSVNLSKGFSLEFDVAGQRKNDAQSLRLVAEPQVDENGVCTHLSGTLQDVSQSISTQKEIHELAYSDMVTGLPNRAQLRKSLTTTLKNAERAGSKFALFFLDLDHFKRVNDTLGHDAGDVLLHQVSKRLSEVLRDSDLVSQSGLSSDEASDLMSGQDTVARIGGDEFVILLGSIKQAADAARVAERIITAINEPYTISDVEVLVTTTIGISVYPEDGRDAEALLKNADVAMYHAKEKGRDGFQFYSNEIHERTLQRFTLERDLKKAIEENQLKLLYQPKLDMSTGEVVGVEALARWTHPEHGVINPADFITLAEETGLIIQLGKWVLNESARQIQQWKENGVGRYSIAVNCSSVQFTRGNILNDVAECIKESGVEPTLLEIELTEKLFLHNIDKGIRMLENLRGLGVKIAIDDFGTDYSSFSYLKRLPADSLKIDKSFVSRMTDDKGDAAIVRAMVTLGHSLDMSIVAEGVETDQQLKMLRQLQCNEVQGYLFSRPLSAEDFEQWLQDRKGPLSKSA